MIKCSREQGRTRNFDSPTVEIYRHLQEKLEQTGQAQQAFAVNAIVGALITTPAMALELGKINISMTEFLQPAR